MVNTSVLSTVSNSILYIVNLSAYLILIKYIQISHNYNNFWYNTLLSIFLSPFYLCFCCQSSFISRFKNYGYSLLYPVFAGLIYTFESILLYYSVNNLNLSYYTILRSSFIIWNIPFFILLLKKKSSRVYYLGTILLLLSYIIIIHYYINLDYELLYPTISIIISCLLNTCYNIMIEYSLKKYNIYNLDFHVIFQISYFCFAIIPSIKMTFQNPPPITNDVLITSAFISICLQLYFYNKIIILENNNQFVPSNVLMAGLDLIRRLVLLLFAFLMYNDDFNIYIGISVTFFLLSGIFIFWEYVKPFTKKIVEYTEMVEL
jgi:drug/metabolite transporter (DMT)-like permease